MGINLEKLKIAMARNCFSVDGLVEKSGLGRTTVSKIINGKQKPSTKTLGLLAKALNVDVTELIVSDEE